MPGTLKFYIKLCYNLNLRPRNMFQCHCTLFTKRNSVGEVFARLGQGERRSVPDKRSQTDTQTGRRMDGQTDHYKAPTDRARINTFELICQNITSVIKLLLRNLTAIIRIKKAVMYLLSIFSFPILNVLLNIFL